MCSLLTKKIGQFLFLGVEDIYVLTPGEVQDSKICDTLG